MWQEDLRFALRSLIKNPGSSLVIVLILAIGIGANTAIFSVVDAVLLKPLPYPDSDELVMIWEKNVELGQEKDGPSPANLLDWRERNEVFTGIAASREESITYLGKSDVREVPSARVSADFFSVMNTDALHGRTFKAEDVEADLGVVVLSYSFHQRYLGGDLGVLGDNVILGGEAREIVGVMPPEFVYPSSEIEVWLPWNFQSAYAHRGGPPRDFRFLDVVARLRPGTSLEQAEANLTSIAAGLAEEYPKTNSGWSVRTSPLKEEIVGDVEGSLWMLFGAVGFVLLVACANVAALLLVRALGRLQSNAIRQAMGASRVQLIRLALCESLILGLLGGLAGLAIAHVGVGLLLALQPGDLPRVGEIHIDFAVLLFTLGVSVLAAIFFGLAPALQGLQAKLVDHLKSGGSRGATAGRSSRLLRQGLVVVEVAMALVLLVGAGLLVRSFITLRAVDPGFDPENVLIAQMNLNRTSYGSDEARSYYQRFLQEIEALPGVEEAGAVSALPMSSVAIDFDRPYWLPGQMPPEEERPEAFIRIPTPGYFEAMGMKVLDGRAFDDNDRDGSLAVVIVNESLARRLWGEESPVDQRLIVDYRGVAVYRVVGVVRDTRFYGLRSEPNPEIFMPHAQIPYLPMSVAIRTSIDPVELSQPVQRLALEIDATQPVQSVTTLESLVSSSVARDRFAVSLLGFLAAVALLLATMGLYGLLVYGVRQQTREIGLRFALGALPKNVIWLVLKESLTLTGIGIGIGLILAFGLTRLLSSFLFGVGAFDPVTFAGTCVLLAVTALLAGLLPARRAARVDLAVTLRDE